MNRSWCFSPVPACGTVFCFQLFFLRIRKPGEKIQTAYFLHAVDRYSKRLQGIGRAMIGNDKRHGYGIFGVGVEKHFIVKFRYRNLIRANRREAFTKNRTGYHQQFSVFSGPVAHLLFAFFPDAPVAFGPLGRHIAEIKRLFHALLRPAHVGSRRQMATVKAGSGVIFIAC